MEEEKNIFGEYIAEGPNSFDANLEQFNHNEPLYPHHVMVNSNARSVVNDCLIFGSENGFFLKKDCIICNVPEAFTKSNEYVTAKLRFYNWNRYYYSYKDADKRGVDYIVYTKLGFEKLRKYVYEATDVAGEEVFDESVIGAMTIVYKSISSKVSDGCTTILLSKKVLPGNKARNIEEPSWAPDALSFASLKYLRTRAFTLSLIHDFLKQTSYSLSPDKKIDFSLLGDWEGYIERNTDTLGIGVLSTDKAKNHSLYDDFMYTLRTKKEESSKFEQYIKDNYDGFSSDLKDICAYLYPKTYKYTPMSKELSCRYRDDKLIAYSNIMMNIFKRGVTDKIAPFTYTEEDANNFHMLFDSVINDILGNKNKLSWLDDDGFVAMEYITGLLLANSDLHHNNIQVKAGVAFWTFYLLYRNMLLLPESEKQLFRFLIVHIIGTNGSVFANLIDKIKSNPVVVGKTLFGTKTASWSKMDSDVCVGEILSYFSDSFIIDEKTLTGLQREYLGYGCHSRANYIVQYKELVDASESHNDAAMDILRKEYADMLFNFMSEILHRQDYTNKCIIDVALSDFSFNLDETIQYEIKEKYLPVRAMTADNMDYLGDVAIIGCNPIRYHNMGSITTSDFELVENENTEYFVFSKQSPLYNEMVRRVHAMDSWVPETYSYKTIKGWVHGELRIVHIDRNLF